MKNTKFNMFQFFAINLCPLTLFTYTTPPSATAGIYTGNFVVGGLGVSFFSIPVLGIGGSLFAADKQLIGGLVIGTGLAAAIAGGIILDEKNGNFTFQEMTTEMASLVGIDDSPESRPDLFDFNSELSLINAELNQPTITPTQWNDFLDSLSPGTQTVLLRILNAIEAIRVPSEKREMSN